MVRPGMTTRAAARSRRHQGGTPAAQSSVVAFGPCGGCGVRGRVQREVEATPWGGLVLGNVWPAYMFALPLGARIWGLRQHAARRHAARPGASCSRKSSRSSSWRWSWCCSSIRRARIQRPARQLAPALVALVGTFLLNVVAYLPIEATTSTTSLLAASAVVVLGTLFTIWSLATLGRCFGLFPEVRGLVLRGPYRLVRHPVYLGEIVSAVGLLMARPHPLIWRCSALFVGAAVLAHGLRGARAGGGVSRGVPGLCAARAATRARLRA